MREKGARLFSGSAVLDLLREARRRPRLLAERLAVAVSASGAGVFEVDPVRGTLWCSERLVEILGRRLSADETRDIVWPVHHPDDRDRVRRVIAEAQRNEADDVGFESRVVLPGGAVRWTDWRLQVRHDAKGALAGVVGLVVDIDERKRQEVALEAARREAEANAERLKLALIASRGGVFEIEHQTGHHWVSPEFERLVGRTVTFADIATPAWAFIHPDDRERVTAHIVHATMSGEVHSPAEWRVVMPNGEHRWVATNGCVYSDELGRLKRVVGFIQDIDARKTQEIALERAREEIGVAAERLALSLKAACAGVFEVDMRAGTFWCSPEFVDIVGRPLTFAEACGVWPMVHPDDVAQVEAGITVPRDDGELAHVEYRIVMPSGEVRWLDGKVLIRKSPEGAFTKIIGLILDVSAAKRQELALIEAERAASAGAEAKSQFLANMSHEIRTPMNGVLGILHLLAREQLSDEARRLVAEAEGCGQMLAQLLNDVIDVSRMEAGRLDLSLEPTDPAAVLASVAGLMRPQAEAKGVDLRVRVEGDPGWVMMDPVRLRQGLFNLIGNAVKFTSQGYVEASLAIGPPTDGYRRLRFDVRDTGIGIPAHAQGKLFQRFQQADGSTARQFGGSGLGLAITRKVAELMGGQVGFNSLEGIGSTFWIDVPAKVADVAGAEAVEPLPSLEGLHILVVEDNATNRLVATKILEALGAQVETAEDGLLGVEAVRWSPFDLVLMDVQMPRMDGVEATRTIRALAGNPGTVPIVGLTANALPHQWQAYREAGMQGVVAKPLSPGALLAEIAAVLGGRARKAA
jgi:PAS domain S-box-containing protein